MTVAVTALASVAAFFAFKHELELKEVRGLADYVVERVGNEDRRFTGLTSVQRAAAAALAKRADGMSPAKAVALFDAKFPLQADGTRRSRPQAFDGAFDADGDYLFGLGAFIARGRDVSVRDKAMWSAAHEVVGHFGEAIRAEYDNFYFYSPDNRLVMFGPDRPDHLTFYRHDAPASLDLTNEQIVRMILPANNPEGRTRCTTLQRLVQDNGGQRLATACATPVYMQGRLVGAFGSSIDLTGYFMKAVRDTVPGAANLIVTSEGDLIAWPGFSTPAIASEKTVARYEKELHLKTLMAAIHKNGGRFGVVQDSDKSHIVAYGLLTGPDWYFLVTYPKAAVVVAAARSASWILVIGLLASLVETLLVVAIARRTITRPLDRLARAAEAEGPGGAAAAPMPDIEARDDEIGVLARALRASRERVDEVLSSLEQRVRDRTAQLEAANQEKSRFLANMSHELRTPLNGVVAVAEVLARGSVCSRAREQAELIASSGRLLERVLSDILDFSKIEAGQMRLETGVFDLATLVTRIAELHRASAEAKGLAMTWRIGEGAGGAYSGDSVRLTQILSNLLSNAVKFTQAGEIELSVEAEATGLKFQVRDTGMGFDEQTRARLFSRFEQADASITRRFGGTGLGLAICRSLAEMMGGRIDAQSSPGHGATFSVVLPLARAAEPAAAPEAAAGKTDADQAPGPGRLRILLAEDHPTNQRVVQMILESSGHELIIAPNGREALDRLKLERFDVVLMDMQMPEMDGLTATAAFRAFERDTGAPRTPVIMLTANALEEHVEAGRAAGGDQHLSKPIRADALIQAIAQAMSDKADKAQAA